MTRTRGKIYGIDAEATIDCKILEFSNFITIFALRAIGISAKEMSVAC